MVMRENEQSNRSWKKKNTRGQKKIQCQVICLGDGGTEGRMTELLRDWRSCSYKLRQWSSSMREMFLCMFMVRKNSLSRQLKCVP